jgi:hypothetical protein
LGSTSTQKTPELAKLQMGRALDSRNQLQVASIKRRQKGKHKATTDDLSQEASQVKEKKKGTKQPSQSRHKIESS